MLRKRSFQTYNDGVADLYRDPAPLNAFNGARNRRTVDGMEPICPAAFAQKAMRQQDVEFADAMGFKLTMKICCPRVPGADAGCFAVIDDYLYRISHADPGKSETYLYLEGVGPIGAPEDH